MARLAARDLVIWSAEPGIWLYGQQSQGSGYTYDYVTQGSVYMVSRARDLDIRSAEPQSFSDRSAEPESFSVSSSEPGIWI